jgi:hypothetical protein
LAPGRPRRPGPRAAAPSEVRHERQSLALALTQPLGPGVTTPCRAAAPQCTVTRRRPAGVGFGCPCDRLRLPPGRDTHRSLTRTRKLAGPPSPGRTGRRGTGGRCWPQSRYQRLQVTQADDSDSVSLRLGLRRNHHEPESQPGGSGRARRRAIMMAPGAAAAAAATVWGVHRRSRSLALAANLRRAAARRRLGDHRAQPLEAQASVTGSIPRPAGAGRQVLPPKLPV